MIMPHIRNSLIVLAALLLAACPSTSLLTPQTAAFQKINETYAREWVDLHTPRPATPTAAPLCNLTDALGTPYRLPGEKPAFAETNVLIEQFRTDYPDAKKEQAALTVRTGVIFLESGSIGLARLNEPKVQEAGMVLTSNDTSPRDALLSRAFPSLVTGWEPIIGVQTLCTDMAKSPDTNFNDDPRQLSADFTGRQKAFVSAGNGITDLLQQERTAGRVDVNAGDGGARQLSLESATFYLWADAIAVRNCEDLELSPSAPRVERIKPFCKDYISGSYLTDAKEVILANASTDEQKILNGQVAVASNTGPMSLQLNTYNVVNNKLANRPFQVRDLKSQLTTDCAAGCNAAIKAIVEDTAFWPADLPPAGATPPSPHQ